MENRKTLIETAKNYAIHCHSSTNHKYDKIHPYEVHLQSVVNFAYKYSHYEIIRAHDKGLIISMPDFDISPIIAACWTHDVIEDCRQTYNSVENVCGKEVADIVYACTNEKGRNRKERANEKFYKGLQEQPYAPFVKTCDRLANILYSVENNSPILDIYRQEHELFCSFLGASVPEIMLREMTRLVSA